MRTDTFLKLLSITCLLFSSICAWSQTQKSLIGFQDIPWGTKFKSVKQKIPDLTEHKICKNEKDIEISKKENQFCSVLADEKYFISAKKYHLYFYFDSKATLNQVTISYDSQFLENINKKLFPIDCIFRFSDLQSLLASRYGEPEINEKTEGNHLDGDIEITSQWFLSPTNITLKSVNSGSEKSKVSNYCGLSVTYSPTISSEAKKL
jgi:hypothetical protein